MNMGFLGALAALAAPVLLGQVSFIRTLVVVALIGGLLIALSLASAWLHNVVELSRLKARAELQRTIEAEYGVAEQLKVSRNPVPPPRPFSHGTEQTV